MAELSDVHLSRTSIEKLSETELGRTLLVACDITPIIQEEAATHSNEILIERGDTVKIKWLTHPDPDIIGTEEKIIIDDSPLAQALIGRKEGYKFFYTEPEDREGIAWQGPNRTHKDKIFQGRVISVSKKEK